MSYEQEPTPAERKRIQAEQDAKRTLGIGHVLAEGHDETSCPDCLAWAVEKVRGAMVRPMADEIAALDLLARAARKLKGRDLP